MIINSSRIVLLSMVLCAIVHIASVAYLSKCNFPNVDENAHLAAGVALLTKGDLRYYRVNPPLVRAIAALPIILNLQETYNYQWSPPERDSRPEFAAGYERVRTQGIKTHEAFFWPRLACLPFSILGLFVAFQLGKELVCYRAGLAAAWLWSTCPCILSNAATINPDLAATAIGAALSLAILRYVKNPTARECIMVGLTAGIAILTKLSWIFLIVLVPVLMQINPSVISVSLRAIPYYARLYYSFLSAIAVILIVNAGYGFQGSGSTFNQSISSVSQSWVASVRPDSSTLLGSVIADAPIPLPQELVLGLAYLKYEQKSGYESYFAGTWARDTWISYYFVAILLKTPLPTLALTCFGLLNLCGVSVRTAAFVFSPAICLAILISAAGGFNHHFRYVLPLYSAIYVIAGMSLSTMRVNAPVCVQSIPKILLFCSVATGMGALPYPHAYFNLIAGGASSGSAWLAFSNIEWGQDLYRLRQFVDTLPSHSTIYAHLAYKADPKILMCRDCREISELPNNPAELRIDTNGKNCYLIFHVTDPTRREYEVLKQYVNLRPHFKIAYSYFVVQINDAK